MIKTSLAAFGVIVILAIALCAGLPVCATQDLGTEGVTDLMRASAASNVAKVKELLTNGADPNAKDNRGATALMWNVSWPEIDLVTNREEFDVKIIDLLIDAGAKLDTQDPTGQTALIRAEGFGHSTVALKLVKRGANVSIKDKKGRSALTYAAWHEADGYDVKELLRAGAKASLIDAMFLLDVPKARELAATADLRDRGPMGETALILAAGLGDPKTVDLLLARGENANAVDGQGFPALLHALGGHPGNGQTSRYWHEFGLKGSRVPIITALLDHGARVDPKLPEGETVLGWAIERRQKDAVDLLLKRRSKPKSPEGFHGTPLNEAIELGDLALVKQLLDAGANPNIANDYYTLPLIAAVSGTRANLEIAKLLLERGAKVNDQQFGRTPLMAAAHEGRDPVYVKLLLNRGAKVNTVAAGEGLTALMLAAGYNSPEVVKALLAAGANVNLRDNEGNTTLDFALKWKRAENVKLLKR